MKFLLTFVVAIVAMLEFAYVLSWAWHWFMVPLFQLPELPVVHAAGIGMMVGMLKLRGQDFYDIPKEKSLEEELVASSVKLLLPWLLLFLFWVVSIFRF